jgi:sugar phosphate isomerase/epimerase
MATGEKQSAPIGSLKGRYPFRVSTTSFIYPASWEENVGRLGPFVDEIELLFFESRNGDALPDVRTIDTLRRQAAELDVGYNIHLPIDIRLGARSGEVRRHAQDILHTVLSLTAELPVSTSTLHLVYDSPDRRPATIERWRERLCESMARLLDRGMEPSAISIENIDYPLEWVAPVISDFGLAVCLDIGHLLIQGIDLQKTFSRWSGRIAAIHLHGVDGGRDHLALDHLPAVHVRPVIDFLASFDGVVSLEVFDLDRLSRSISCFRRWTSGRWRPAESAGG